MKLRTAFRALFLLPLVAVKWLVGLLACDHAWRKPTLHESCRGRHPVTKVCSKCGRPITVAMTCLILLYLLSGDVQASGWTYAGGYWFYNGVAYQEKQYYEPYTYTYYACDSYGCRRPYTATAYRWNTYYEKVIVVPGPNAVNQMMGILAARDAGEIANRKIMTETLQLVSLSKEFGLTGNFKYDGYGTNFGLPMYLNAFSSTEQTQTGNTLFAKTMARSQTDIYGHQDIDAWMLREQQNQADAEAYNAKRNERVSNTVQIGVDGAKEVARLQAMRDIIREAGRATEPQAKTTIKTESSSSTPVIPQPVVPPVPQPVPPKEFKEAAPLPKEVGLSEDELKAFHAMAGPKSCFSCHGAGKENQGAFDITTYHPKTASRSVKKAVLMYGEGASKCTGPKLKPEDRLQMVLP